MKINTSGLRIKRGYLAMIVFMALAVYVILPQFGEFRNSWRLALDPQADWLALAALAAAVPYVAAAGVYNRLAFKPLPFGRTVLVQIATTFINRVLPAGLGALGANYLYLRRQRHTSAQAAAVVGVNNLLGFIGHGLIFVIAIALAGGSPYEGLDFSFSDKRGSFFIIAISAIAAISLAALLLGKRLQAFINDTWSQIASYRRRVPRLAQALLYSMCLTLFSVASLYLCAEALNLNISFLAALIIFTIGLTAGTATPSPGGLGGFELGLVAGFTAYQVDYAPALAVTLLFRLITYWAVLAIGFVAFLEAQRRNLFLAG